MAKLTRMKALEVCEELWDWIVERKITSSAGKQGWPGFEGNSMAADCPCCQYGRDVLGGDKEPCAVCPLKGKWHPSKSEVCCIDGLYPVTITKVGYYAKWCEGDTQRKRTYYAKKIRDAARDELKLNYKKYKDKVWD